MPTADEELAESIPTRTSEDPASVAINRDLVSELLANTSPDVVQMLLLTAHGYSQLEIAARLGTTPEAVSSALRRFRRTKDR
jgi:DNA-directed RNA polymerase specialized sigma24 family protein